MIAEKLNLKLNGELEMKVSEIFKSIQGEGSEVGRTTVFLRLSGCNLSCGFCDSKYAKNGKEMTVEEVAREIKKYNVMHVTVTGGEPTLQDKELQDLIYELDEHHFSLETNGTKYTETFFDSTIVSPKKQKIEMQVLNQYLQNDCVNFKFVYEDKNDKWWEAIIYSLKISPEKVYIMAEGATREKQMKKMSEVIDYCLKKNYNFSPRLHVLVWDIRRGV